MHLFNFRFFSRLFCFIHLQILFASFPVVSVLFMFCPREYPAGHLAINWKKTSLAIVSCHSSPYDRQRQSKVDFDVNQTWFRSIMLYNFLRRSFLLITHCHVISLRSPFAHYCTSEAHILYVHTNLVSQVFFSMHKYMQRVRYIIN